MSAANRQRDLDLQSADPNPHWSRKDLTLSSTLIEVLHDTVAMDAETLQGHQSRGGLIPVSSSKPLVMSE